MIRVIGIDPGTKSFDICGIEEENGQIKVFLEESIPSEDLAKDPYIIIDLIKKNNPIELIVGPSGYGVELKHISKLTELDKKLMILVRKEDIGIPVLKGLKKIIEFMEKEKLNVYFIPGVIHLPTVPYYRKINKIDMGTADKLCCAILGIYDQAKHLNISYSDTCFILLEIGYAYNACIGVRNGKIIDGIGGTNASISFKSLGSMDGELAYILGKFEKMLLFSGGVSELINSDFPIDMIKNEEVKEGFFEGLEKMVCSIMVSVGYPKEILVSGRLSKYEEIYEEVRKRLRKYSNVRRINGFAKIKEAAQGAAIIANGLANGMFKEIVEITEIKKSYGTILDYINLKKYKDKIFKELEILK